MSNHPLPQIVNMFPFAERSERHCVVKRRDEINGKINKSLQNIPKNQSAAETTNQNKKTIMKVRANWKSDHICTIFWLSSIISLSYSYNEQKNPNYGWLYIFFLCAIH